MCRLADLGEKQSALGETKDMWNSDGSERITFKSLKVDMKKSGGTEEPVIRV